MPEPTGDELTRLLDQSQALSAQIGRLRGAGESVDALIAQHRGVSARIAELRAAQEDPIPAAEGPAEPRVSVITSEADFLALRDEWNELLDNSPAPTPFLRWEWLYSWWEIFGTGKQLRLILVREAEGGVLIGLAPMMLGLRERGRLQRRALAFLGTGEVAEGDYFNAIVRREREEVALATLWRGLRQLESEYDYVRLCEVDTADPAPLSLVGLAARDGQAALVQTRRFSVLGPLPGSFEEFIASVPDKQRRNYLRDMDRHFRAQNLSVEHATASTAAEIEETLRAIANFSIARQQAKGRQSAWRDPAFADFMRRACVRLHERREIEADVLRHDGKALAALLGFVHRGTYYCYQMGFDAESAPLSPLHYLLGQRLRMCVASGCIGFDFLAGEHEYKTQYFTGRRPVGQITFWRGGYGRGGGRVAGGLLAQEVRQRVKAWIKSHGNRTARTEIHE